jgi:hypothetical protein
LLGGLPDAVGILGERGWIESTETLTKLVWNSPGSFSADPHVGDNREEESESILMNELISRRILSERGIASSQLTCQGAGVGEHSLPNSLGVGRRRGGSWGRGS